MKTTLIIGASTNEERYAFKAAKKLREHNHAIYLFGNKAGEIEGNTIETNWNPDWKVDTITLYLGPKNQVPYYDKIVALKPNRVIFNPGTENTELEEFLQKNQIQVEIACTLVLLTIDRY